MGATMVVLSRGQEHWLCSEGAQKREYSTTDQSGHCKTPNPAYSGDYWV